MLRVVTDDEGRAEMRSALDEIVLDWALGKAVLGGGSPKSVSRGQPQVMNCPAGRDRPVGVVKMARLAAQLKAAGLATRTKARDRPRSVRRRAHAIGAWLRRRSDDAKHEAKALTGEMATMPARPSPMPATWLPMPDGAFAPDRRGGGSPDTRR